LRSQSTPRQLNYASGGVDQGSTSLARSQKADIAPDDARAADLLIDALREKAAFRLEHHCSAIGAHLAFTRWSGGRIVQPASACLRRSTKSQELAP
jgi:hypothetical protein